MKDRLFLRCISGFISIFMLVAVLVSCQPVDDGYEYHLYMHDELLQAFNENQELLTETAKMLMSHQRFWDECRDKYEDGSYAATYADIYSPYSDKMKVFEGDDKEKMESAFGLLKPYEISKRTRNGINYIQIVFVNEERSGCYLLEYIPGAIKTEYGELTEVGRRISDISNEYDAEDLGNGWYMYFR